MHSTRVERVIPNDRRKLSILRHKNCRAIAADVVKCYDISGFGMVVARGYGISVRKRNNVCLTLGIT